MSPATHPSIPHLVENPILLNELETEDLFSLKAALQNDDDPRLDSLWELVVQMTGSLD